jgi:HlyD family secretion protein
MSRQGRVRAIAAMAFVLAVAATASVVYNNRTDASSPYITEPVQRGDLVQYVRSRGELTPVVISVGTQISGTVVQISTDINQPVKKGQVLALIDPKSYEQKLQQARSELKRVTAARDFLELKEQRYKRLLGKGFTTQLSYAEVKADLEQALSEITAKDAAVREAENNLSHCTIRSSTDGILLDKRVNVGETVHVGTSIAPVLFLIAEDLRRMRIVAAIKEIDVGKVQPGQEARFTAIAVPGRAFQGRVAHVLSTFNPQQNLQEHPSTQQSTSPSFKVDIAVDNADLTLQPMFTARVEIAVNKKERVLLVPNSALRIERLATTDKNTGIVYRFPKTSISRKPEPVIVKLGLTDDVATEVLSGLAEGDIIVTGIAAMKQTS